MPRKYIPRNTRKRQAIIPIGPSIAYIPLTRGFYALIDSSDASWLTSWNWCAMVTESGMYAARRERQTEQYPRGEYILLHRQILELERGILGDHRNGNTWDYRRDNLRAVNMTQNVRNARVRNESFSGLKGAFHYSNPNSRKPWYSRIKVNGKMVKLGSFATALDAHEAYCKAASEAFGEYASFRSRPREIAA